MAAVVGGSIWEFVVELVDAGAKAQWGEQFGMGSESALLIAHDALAEHVGNQRQ